MFEDVVYFYKRKIKEETIKRFPDATQVMIQPFSNEPGEKYTGHKYITVNVSREDTLPYSYGHFTMIDPLDTFQLPESFSILEK